MTVLRTLTYWFKRETERERERAGGEVGGREGERERERAGSHVVTLYGRVQLKRSEGQSD